MAQVQRLLPQEPVDISSDNHQEEKAQTSSKDPSTKAPVRLDETNGGPLRPPLRGGDHLAPSWHLAQASDDAAAAAAAVHGEP